MFGGATKPSRDRQRGEHALREEILNICKDSFLGFDIEGYFPKKFRLMPVITPKSTLPFPENGPGWSPEKQCLEITENFSHGRSWLCR